MDATPICKLIDREAFHGRMHAREKIAVCSR
jgi:hypothetical protein